MDWITDWDNDLDREIKYLDVYGDEYKRYRVDVWKEYGYTGHDEGKLFSHLEEALKHARKKMRVYHQVRVVDLGEEM